MHLWSLIQNYSYIIVSEKLAAFGMGSIFFFFFVIQPLHELKDFIHIVVYATCAYIFEGKQIVIQSYKYLIC